MRPRGRHPPHGRAPNRAALATVRSTGMCAGAQTRAGLTAILAHEWAQPPHAFEVYGVNNFDRSLKC